MNPAKWTVRRIAGRWTIQPPYPVDQEQTYPTWRAAFDAADRLARGLA